MNFVLASRTVCQKDFCKKIRRQVTMSVFAVLLIIAGIVLAAVPNMVYDFTQSWKNNGVSSPSDFYRNFTRVQGIVFVIAGIVLLVK